MTNKDAVKALKDVKAYTQSKCLEAIDYAIEVLEKLEAEGIKNPLSDKIKKEE